MSRPLNSYEKAIKDIQTDIYEMGKKVSNLLELSLEALIEQNTTKAQGIIALEDEIDDLDYDIEMRALELISLQQPLDYDLRVLAAVMRISKDLERIGDLAVNIAEITINLSTKGTYFKQLIDIPRMYELASSMLSEALNSYIDNNSDKAYEVNKSDDEVDLLYDKLYQELINYMKSDAKYVEQASYLILVARFLERIADHAVNIAEMTIYQVSGIRRPFND